MSSPLQDEFEVHRLLAEYCHLCDDGNFDALLDCFEEDAFVFGKSTASGREELFKWFETTQSPGRRGKHITANVIVKVDGNEASAVSDFVFLVRSDDVLKPLVAGRYVDDLRHDGDRWRFGRRVAIPLLENHGKNE